MSFWLKSMGLCFTVSFLCWAIVIGAIHNYVEDAPHPTRQASAPVVSTMQ